MSVAAQAGVLSAAGMHGKMQENASGGNMLKATVFARSSKQPKDYFGQAVWPPACKPIKTIGPSVIFFGVYVLKKLLTASVLAPAVLAVPIVLAAHPPAATKPAPAAAKARHVAPAAIRLTHLPKANPGALVVTRHHLTIDGTVLDYTATTGYMPIRSGQGKLLANIFFTAFIKNTPAGKADHRPLTFCFNGGPGAASNWLNIGCAGPFRLQLTPRGNVPPPPFKLVKNHQSWLNATDLVFVDPVGTGYSRKAAGVPGQNFYGVTQDISSVANFIRLYMTMYKRWSSPVFLGGESYGTTRAAGLSDYLSAHEGIDINGMILISCALNFQLIVPNFGNDTPYPLFLPTYTTTAWYYHKLSPELEKHFHRAIAEAEHFAVNVYTPALEMGSRLSQARQQQIAAQMANLTGLSSRYILRAHLRVGPGMFEQQLLRNAHRVIGRMDTRLSAYTPNGVAGHSNFDPAMSRFTAAFTTGFNQLVRSKLHYKNFLPYRTLSNRVYPWHFGTGGMGFLYVTDNLQRGMIRDPSMKVLVCSGYFDLATPFFSTIYSMDHLQLSRKLQSHIKEVFFRGGHMVYHPRKMLVKLHKEVVQFIASAK